MITNNHLLISNIIYDYCSKELKLNLNKWNFAYGNIRPDFVKHKSNYCHCFTESINIDNMQEKYDKENKSFMNDVTYAISTAIEDSFKHSYNGNNKMAS